MSSSRAATQTGGREATEGHIAGDVALAVGKPSQPPPDGFTWRALTDLARLETGHTPSRKTSEYWDGGTLPWIGIRDASANHGREISATNEYITELGEQNSSTRLLPKGTVCLSRTASVGYVIVMGRPMCTSQDFVNWVCGPDLDHRYLKYILMAERNSFLRFAHGTTHQTIYFPEVKAFHVLVPSIAEQRATAGVLGALDDKIESNRRIRSISTALARIAVERCVSGCETRRLGDIVELIRGFGYSSAGIEDAGTPMISMGTTERRGWLDRSKIRHYGPEVKPKYHIGPESLLVVNVDLTWKLDVLGWPLMTPDDLEDSIFSNDIYFLSFAEDFEWLKWIVWSEIQSIDARSVIEGGAKGTTVASLGRDTIEMIPIRVPDLGEGASVADEARSLLRRAWSAERESARLAKLRDTLLPELLSGRLRVRDAESLLEDAL